MNERFVKLFVLSTVLFFGYGVAAEVLPEQIPQWQVQLNGLIAQAQSPWVGGVVLLLIELSMRIFKTQDPKSLLYVIANGLKLLSKLMETVAGFIDQYIQRLK